MNAKHQTSRSSRSRRQVLDRVAAAASNSSWPRSQPIDHFPSLAPTSQPPAKPTPGPSRSQQKSATPWTSSNGQGSNSGFRPQVQQPVSVSKPQPKKTAAPPRLSGSAFPELPVTAVSHKPPKEFISGNKSLKRILGDTLPARPAWGQGPSTTQPSSPPPGPEPEPATAKGRKGKGKQKQTLFTLGTFPT